MPADHGSPHRTVDAQLRGIDEMLGLCRRVIFDGEIEETEAAGLAQWIRDHREMAAVWPANIVARRLGRIFVDGMVAWEEREALRDLLAQVLDADSITGREATWSRYLGMDGPPPIEIRGRRFCFMGKFFFGTRTACKAEVVDRGGKVLDTVGQDLDYVVVGLLGSPALVGSADGAEIQKAMDYRVMGLGPVIVSERQWAAQLGQA